MKSEGLDSGKTERSRGLRIGLAQIAVTDGGKERNLAAAREAVAEAAAQGADLVVLPEMVLSGFGSRDELLPLAETRSEVSGGAFSRMAVEHGVAVVAGFPELEQPGDVIYNTTVAFGRLGEPLAFHRKTHLYNMERFAITPGTAIDARFTFQGIRFGLLCCYEIEFPEAARTLALSGAQCIVVPTGNMLPWDRHHRVYIQARAMENQVFVAYCNRFGTSPAYQFPGESALVDPLGRIVVDAGAGEKVTCARLELGLIEESRMIVDYLHDRRPDSYVCR